MREPALGDTDAERAILADALTEAGDVRGELIALDLHILSAEGERRTALLERVAQLRADHHATLFGYLAPAVIDAAWDRGAPDAVDLDLTHLPSPVEAPPTVRRVRIVRGTSDDLPALLAALPGLTVLAGRVGVGALARLAGGSPLPIVRLDLERRSLPLGDDDVRRLVLEGPGLSHVREVILRDAVPDGYDPSELAATRMGRSLRSIEVPAPFVDLPLWFHAMRDRLPALQRLRISELLGNTSWTLTRTDDGLHLAADARLAILTVWRRSVKADLAIAEVLDLLPPACLVDVEVTIGSAYRGTRTTRETLEDSIARVVRHP